MIFDSRQVETALYSFFRREQDNALRCTWLCLVQFVLQCLPVSWDNYLKNLRQLETLLARVDNRDQVISRCVENIADRTPFKSWASRLKGLRWERITEFCAEDFWLNRQCFDLYHCFRATCHLSSKFHTWQYISLRLFTI